MARRRIRRASWYLYVYSVAYNDRDKGSVSGSGNGTVSCTGKPNLSDWSEIAKDIAKERGFPEGSVVITNYIPMTK